MSDANARLADFTLGREHLLPEAGNLAAVVAELGRAGGVKLLDAFLFCCFTPQAAERGSWFYRQVFPVVATDYPGGRAVMRGNLLKLMVEALGLNPGAVLRVPLGDEMLTVHAVPPGAFEPVQLDTATVMQGRLTVLDEVLTDYRTDHRNLFGSITLKPTEKALGVFFPPFNTVAAFTAVLDEPGCSYKGDRNPNGHHDRIIRMTKRQVYTRLEELHPGKFGTFESFKSKFSQNGDWAETKLRYRIQWGRDSGRKGAQEPDDET